MYTLCGIELLVIFATVSKKIESPRRLYRIDRLERVSDLPHSTTTAQQPDPADPAIQPAKIGQTHLSKAK